MTEATTEDYGSDLPLSLKSLIDAGVHFGHQTRRWDPKMRPFIFGARNGIHIIDLDQTALLFKRAYDFLVESVGRGGHVLFVGTGRPVLVGRGPLERCAGFRPGKKLPTGSGFRQSGAAYTTTIGRGKWRPVGRTLET